MLKHFKLANRDFSHTHTHTPPTQIPIHTPKPHPPPPPPPPVLTPTLLPPSALSLWTICHLSAEAGLSSVGLQQNTVMPLGTPAPLFKRKKLSKIITDLSHITQDEYDSEPEASEFDLGNKIRSPKDIMLEELSLLKNQGSKMFRMRQKRMEKFIHENNPDVFCSESMDNLQKFVPSMGGQIGSDMITVAWKKNMQELEELEVQVVQEVQEEQADLDVSSTGGGCDDATKITLKGYMSPWEKAMKGDENLIATLKAGMPGPTDRKDLPKYKSFNRFAMPFGGFDKASQFMKFQMPEAEATEPEAPVVYQQEIGCRPSFNRTPIGWMGSSEPSSIHMENDAEHFDGETEEL
ncbi:unnamed protein product [Pleuronectes platessa]|uniref:Myozenin 1 n=1 Tax=Pleuronectes platessa TaxID=8262 RepID=A0A9N7Z2A7_PLEPL|nr:unnamed protein product [Pleuronectes platessa]